MSGSPDPSADADDARAVGRDNRPRRWGDAASGSRRHPTLPMALIALPWLVGAYGIVPRVIASAYRGESVERLNRVFATRRGKPLEHFLQLWWDLANALNLAALTWLGLAWWFARRIDDRKHRNALVVHAGLFLLVTVLAGPRHDYVAFAEIWASILKGSDPWAIHPVYGYATHAYGPAFNLLALPFAIHPMLPKILFAAAFLLYTSTLPATWLTRLLSLFAWTEVAWFGHFDVLVGLCCVASARWARTKPIACGGMLGLGVLLKIVPIALAPFAAMEAWRPRWKAALTIVATVVIGYTLSYLIWGPSVFRPFGFAAGRGSTFASIFRFLRGEWSPLRLLADRPDLDRFAGPALLLGGLALFAWTRFRNTPAATGMTLAAFLTVLLYQVGFLQYQMVAVLLLVDLLRDRRRAASSPLMAAALLDLGWLAVLNLWYASVGGVIHPGDPWAWADEWVGLPTFGCGLFVVVCLVRESRRPDWA